MIEIVHNGPDGLLLGVVHAWGLDAAARVPSLESTIDVLLGQRSTVLSPGLDERRTRVRDVFRNGTYKPTGRAKPASEYLVRAASEGRFPRINTLVDACNTASLESFLPISVLDIDRADAQRFSIRLGRPGEEYVFNTAGQVIGLEDLIVGCAEDTPVVNAVKDSMATKTTPQTSRILAFVYGVNAPDLRPVLDSCCEMFSDWVGKAGSEACSTFRVVEPGGTVRVSEAYGASEV